MLCNAVPEMGRHARLIEPTIGRWPILAGPSPSISNDSIGIDSSVSRSVCLGRVKMKSMRDMSPLAVQQVGPVSWRQVLIAHKSCIWIKSRWDLWSSWMGPVRRPAGPMKSGIPTCGCICGNPQFQSSRMIRLLRLGNSCNKVSKAISH